MVAVIVDDIGLEVVPAREMGREVQEVHPRLCQRDVRESGARSNPHPREKLAVRQSEFQVENER
jgi:hypothetical protein